MVDGQVRHFSAGGLYDGMALLIDDESHTYWSHLTGEALYGPDAGKKLVQFPLEVLSAKEAEVKYPDLKVSIASENLLGSAMAWMTGNPYHKAGWFPPGFRGTMGKTDDRLPEMTVGLGVVAGNQAKFYPFSRIAGRHEDSLDGRTLIVDYPPGASAPSAHWESGGDPVQLLCRWYGFAYSYPGCAIYEETGGR